MNDFSQMETFFIETSLQNGFETKRNGTHKADIQIIKVIIAELSRKLVEENARSKMDQEAFMRKYNSYSAKYDEESEKGEQLKTLRSERLGKADVISAFMFAIHEQETFIEDFSEKLWLSTIDVVVVGHDGSLTFKFKNGKEIIK